MLTMLWIVDDHGRLNMTWVDAPASEADLLRAQAAVSREPRTFTVAARPCLPGSGSRERIGAVPELTRA